MWHVDRSVLFNIFWSDQYMLCLGRFFNKIIVAIGNKCEILLHAYMKPLLLCWFQTDTPVQRRHGRCTHSLWWGQCTGISRLLYTKKTPKSFLHKSSAEMMMPTTTKRWSDGDDPRSCTAFPSGQALSVKRAPRRHDHHSTKPSESLPMPRCIQGTAESTRSSILWRQGSSLPSHFAGALLGTMYSHSITVRDHYPSAHSHLSQLDALYSPSGWAWRMWRHKHSVAYSILTVNSRSMCGTTRIEW